MCPGFAPRARERSRRVQNTELRPLGAGEMLDRAITLYVRRFALIVTVLAVVSVPIVLLEALTVPDRKSTRLNSSHANISYAVFCSKKKKHSTRVRRTAL